MEIAEKMGGILLEGIGRNLIFKRKNGDYFLLETTVGGEWFGIWRIYKNKKKAPLFVMHFDRDESPLIGYYYLSKRQSSPPAR